MSEDNIVRYTVEELRAKRARGESQTDWARIDAMTEEELEASIADDLDWNDVPHDWVSHTVPVPAGAHLTTLPVASDLLDWFLAQGPGAEARMNAVLRAHMEAHVPAPAEG